MATKEPQAMSYWQKTAASLKGEQNPEWIDLLRGNLQTCHPERLAHLAAANDLEAYLKVRVSTAETQFQTMLEAGMDTETATELTLKDLLEPAPDEANRSEDWETEGADADMVAAMSQLLGQ